MDKYEYRLKSEEIQRLLEKEEYAEAAEIADSIDWRRVKSATMLQKIAALYRVNRRNEDSKEILMLAYDRYPTNRSVLYSLCEVSIELDEVVQAIEYYKEFVRQAPRDNGVFTLRYKILEAQEASLEERIELLEELKKRDYQEEWGYELAYLYHRVGLATKCVEECDDIILWFGDGPVVMKAMELKMLHTPLTKVQQQKYEDMKYKQELEASGYTEEDSYTEEYYGQQDDYQNNQYVDENGQYYQDTTDGEPYSSDSYYQENYEDNYNQKNYEDAQYTEDGYTQDGYENAQYAEDGYTKDSYENAQYAEDGYTQDGYENTQYAEDGYTQDGYENTQYAEDGYIEEDYENAQYQSDAYYQSEPYEEQDSSSSSVYQQNVSQDDLSQYNTINLQKVVADSMKELYEKDKDLFDTSRDLLQPQHIEEVEEQYEASDASNNLYDEVIDQALENSDMYQQHVEVNEDTDYADTSDVATPSFTMPEQSPILEKKNTGKMYVDDVLTEWEKMKKDAEEKRLEEVRQRVLQQTGSILQNFETAATSGLLAGLEGSSEISDLTEDELQEALEEEQNMQIEEQNNDHQKEDIREDTSEKLNEIEKTASEVFFEDDDVVEEVAEIEEDNDAKEIMSYMEAIGAGEEDEEDDALLFQTAEGIVENQEEQTDAEEIVSYEDEMQEPEEAEYYEDEMQEPEEAEYYEDEIQEPEEAEYYEDEMQESEEAEYYEDEMQESEEAEYYEDEMQAAIEQDLQEEESILKNAKKNLKDVEQLSGTLEEETLGQKNSSKVMMDTAEISSIEQRIIETTKKETSPAKEEVRDFTEEEEELFESFAQTKKVKKQIINALDKISLASYTGNVLITGEPGLGTVDLAKNILKEVQATDSNFSGKVAKITGEKLNLKNLEQTFQKLNNGALLIEKANGCTEECLYNMSRVLDQEDRGIIVIMEDTRHNMMQLLKKQAMIADYFNIRIDLVEMNNDALVAYAKNYALEQEYSIDELGILALYTRIADIQAGNHVVTVEEVKEIVDEAIWNSKRFKLSNFVDVLFAKRYDKDDMIVLRERDFI